MAVNCTSASDSALRSFHSSVLENADPNGRSATTVPSRKVCRYNSTSSP
ncbi:Uncharacterised protein [Mycobacteroides abscessus subsp. abscessus]|nr:Uncharacterised protein [Mycobacteroides abscessus subsp. abscessus]